MLRIALSGDKASLRRPESVLEQPLGMHQARIGAVPGNNDGIDPKHPLSSEASAFPLFHGKRKDLPVLAIISDNGS
jgi:hypothetical protein